MSAKLTISGKVMGKTRPTFANWELLLPEELAAKGITLRSLLTHIVHAEVEAFRSRQSQRRLLNILSPEQIQAGLAQGKIESGGSDLDQAVEVEEAVETALQAFLDGFYYVFLDEQQVEDLDTEVVLSEQSELLFLRLVPLVGG
ncbi:hypothetical protein [Leptolyngbya sp. NIES-2104]|uniref:hypothetical protein n=1 Tax=Leptolyngbya sp. NIES-2104 TaxID=1552121 RepID=UPI0006ECA4C3|nr:hypothetical protein [Leptolyngbya sp. NIES-2104]GAP98109.1 hypothetical protein NIES2104_46620 [Leptolyngbya sp. NIES-2104]